MARVPDEAIRRRKDLTHGAWNLYVEYCRHRNHETGRCDPHLSTLARNLDRTYGYVSDCKAELVKEGWIRRAGKNSVELLVGFDPPKVRAAPPHPKYRRRAPKNPDVRPEIFRTQVRKNPDTSPGSTRTQVREESGLGAASPYSEPGIEPVVEAAADSAAGSPPAPDPGALACTEAYLAVVKAGGRYPPDFVDFVWRKLRDVCVKESAQFGYNVLPTINRFEWWLEHELTPPQPSLLPDAGRAGDVRLGPKRKCDESCPQCFGAGMWYPEGHDKGVARCSGPPDNQQPLDDGQRVRAC